MCPCNIQYISTHHCRDFPDAMMRQARLGEHMPLSWYGWDRGFESPQYSGECHTDGAVPGYVDYGIP
jgi:hypothetical protein